MMPKAVFAKEVDENDSGNRISSCKIDKFIPCMILKVAFAKKVIDNDFGNEIFSGKVDKFALCIIPKAIFTKEVDNDDTDFELTSCGRICRASKLFAGDNQTQESIIGYNVVGPTGRQKLLKVKLLKKKQYDEWLHFCRCSGINII